MSLPGQPGSVVPAGPDWIARELAALSDADNLVTLHGTVVWTR